ncbi:MAG: beta-phosphoglucomutase [Nitriliruptoraceae bacterium]|nr:beta-phosphoglucomutase [Nitriliruptoraceae bacterium]
MSASSDARTHRAVIFDLDGVLTDTAEFHYLAWQRLADEEGLPFDREANEELRGVSRRDSLLKLLGDREVDQGTFDDMMERKNRSYLDLLEEMTPRDALPGAVSLVIDAKRRGLLVAIGSSSKNAPFVLERLGLDALFDAIADGNSVEDAKPAPDLFLHAASLLDVPPETCIVMEDAASGVDAALAAGMTAVGIGPAERVGHGHHRFDTTYDVDLADILVPDEGRIGNGPILQDGWVVIDDHHDPDQVINVATSHLTGNGYLGYRGTLPEWEAGATVGCTVSDTWDNADGKWSELCNVPNALYARWEVLGEPIVVDAENVLSDRDLLERRLDVRYGRQHRVLAPASGSVDRLVDERFASMDQRHLLAQRQRLFASPGTRLTFRTGIDGEVWSLNGDHFAFVESHIHDDALAFRMNTTERGLPIAVGHAASLTGGEIRGERIEEHDRRLMRIWDVEVGESGAVVVDQVMTVFSGNDVDYPLVSALDLARDSIGAGYEPLLAAHALAWDERWARIDVGVHGDQLAQTVLRYNLYHNVIATPMHADHLPIGARGLSCQAYQGAAFWDQEVFNLPMWVHTFPEVARNQLAYRYRTLDGARRKAERLGYAGAFYAWISGDTGDELCPDFFFVDVLTGRPIRNHFNDWQMHISPDVAVAIDGYVRATGDDGLLAEGGAEIVFEVARFLASFVHLKPADGAYHLIRLLGPDEYHENVDDNVFTLEQSRVALREALTLWDDLQERDADGLASLRDRLGLTDDDRALWADILDRLVTIEPDPESLLLEQFDGYFDLEDVEPDALKERLEHPDEYWGWPNGIAVHTQVIKQPDIVQLFVAQPERFPAEVIEANYDYYLPRTQHGSSLSRPMYGLVAARMGRVEQAYELFMRGATVDLLADSHPAPGGTFIGGIHTAACGATWQVAVLGFGGVHVRDDHVEVAPRLPADWEQLDFGLAVRGGWLDVVARHDRVVVSGGADNPEPVRVRLHGRDLQVAPGEQLVVDIDLDAQLAPS